MILLERDKMLQELKSLYRQLDAVMKKKDKEKKVEISTGIRKILNSLIEDLPSARGS